MIGLNIMTDFCSYWWLWWILPFVLGCALATVVMSKWKRMYEDLMQDTRKGRIKITKAEKELEESIKERKDQKGEMAILRGKILELETALKRK